MDKKILIGSIIAAAVLILVPFSSAVDVGIERGNQPPDKPKVIGPFFTKAGIPYECTIRAIDPDGDNVSYQIDWADGDISEWTDWYPSGEEITQSHYYSEERHFSIKARAKDIHGAIGEWGHITFGRPKNIQRSFSMPSSQSVISNIPSNGNNAEAPSCKSNNPPYEPSEPFPENGSSDVPLNAILSWTGGDPDQGDVVTYDVYFDTTHPPTQRVWNQNETFWIPDPELCAQCYYCWQIVAWDNHDASTKGPIWWFTTRVWVPPPVIYGPHSGKPGVEYDYEFVLCSPYQSFVSFYIEWGDGNITDWTEFSLERYSESHTWSEEGVYTIRAKAKEWDGYETGWSYFEVTVPKNNPFNKNLSNLLFKNFPLLYRLVHTLGWQIE